MKKISLKENSSSLKQKFVNDSHFEVTGLKIREAKLDVALAHVTWRASNLLPSKHLYTQKLARRLD